MVAMAHIPFLNYCVIALILVFPAVLQLVGAMGFLSSWFSADGWDPWMSYPALFGADGPMTELPMDVLSCSF
jgi:hypothetical protein